MSSIRVNPFFPFGLPGVDKFALSPRPRTAVDLRLVPRCGMGERGTKRGALTLERRIAERVQRAAQIQSFRRIVDHIHSVGDYMTGYGPRSRCNNALRTAECRPRDELRGRYSAAEAVRRDWHERYALSPVQAPPRYVAGDRPTCHRRRLLSDAEIKLPVPVTVRVPRHLLEQLRARDQVQLPAHWRSAWVRWYRRPLSAFLSARFVGSDAAHSSRSRVRPARARSVLAAKRYAGCWSANASGPHEEHNDQRSVLYDGLRPTVRERSRRICGRIESRSSAASSGT